MKKICAGVLFLLFSSIILFAQENAPPKYALVIGNGAYTGLGRLANPVNDANDIAAVLEALGFTVDTVLNGTLEQMENAIALLKNRLSRSRESYGFFFYAGHGVQSNGENYLIPVDANIPSENNLRNRAFSVQAALDDLNDAKNALNLVVLDACRDNPFGWSRSGSRGLATIRGQPAGSIIVYSTSAGQQARDGEGRNGLFTGQLLNNLAEPGLEVKEVFNRTGADVSLISGNQQIPAIYSQFFGTAYLGGAPDTDVVARPVPRPQPAPAKAPVSADKDAWKKKWVYVGGGFGLGSTVWKKNYHFIIPEFPYYYDHEVTDSGLLYVPGLTTEFFLLPFFSLECDFCLGLMGYADRKLVPVIPVLAKFGGRFSRMELFFDIGYTAGAGFTLGGTAGVNIGPGILFAKYLSLLPKSEFKAADHYNLFFGMTGFLGYKIGVFNKRK